jgi:hypothetical protein
MKAAPCLDWKPIGPRQYHLWIGGILAIVHRKTGRTYFVGTTNVGKRVRDQYRWLTSRSHHNADLQNDWTTGGFDFYLARRVTERSSLNREKQELIDEFAKDGNCYNKKRACAIVKERPKPSTVEGMLWEMSRMVALWGAP